MISSGQRSRERQSELQQVLDLAPQHIGVFGLTEAPSMPIAQRWSIWASASTVGETKQPDTVLFTRDRERFLGERKRRLLEGAPHEFEVRLLGHDGKFRCFLFRLNPLKDERGQITRWYSTGIEIEERKQAEDTLRRENVALREEIDKASIFEEIIRCAPTPSHTQYGWVRADFLAASGV